MSFGQLPGKSQYQINGRICIDSPDTLGAYIVVMSNKTVLKASLAGKNTVINATVPELPVRLSIIITPFKKLSFTIANYWVETSDTFQITGNYSSRDSVIFFPHNELNAFEYELLKTTRIKDKLRLFGANSNNEAGLYNLWLYRFDYKLSELDYILRRAKQTSTAFSSYQLLMAFNEAKTTEKQLANGPWKSFVAKGSNQQLYSIPAPDKKYTLVYLQIPGAQKLDFTHDILHQAHLLYRDQLQVYTLSYPNLQPPTMSLLISSPISFLEPGQPWPYLYDYTGESLLHFRVKLKAPLSNGFEYGLYVKNRKESYISIEASQNYTNHQWVRWNFDNNYSKQNKPEIMLLSTDGRLLGRWTGHYQKNILTDLKKIMNRNDKHRLLTIPE